MMEDSKWINRLRPRCMIEKSSRIMLHKQDNRIAFIQRNLSKYTNKINLLQNDIHTIDTDMDTIVTNTKILGYRIFMLQNLIFIQFTMSLFIFIQYQYPSFLDELNNIVPSYENIVSIYNDLKNKCSLD